MNLKIFLLLIGCSVILGCSPKYVLISQDKLAEFPCSESATGVNVRIRNVGKITFSQFTINVGDQTMTFPGLEPGEISCYKNMSHIWSYNGFSIVYLKKNGDRLTTRSDAIDHVGDENYRHGYFTINIMVVKRKLDWKYPSYGVENKVIAEKY